MRYSVTINNIVIPDAHVITISQSERTLKFAGSNLIASKSTIALSNIYYVYDDRQGTLGLFKDVDWYNWVVTIYDNELGRQVWYGRLKSYIIDDSKMQTTITSSDYVQDMVDTNCVIALSGKTASEIIYAILTDAALLNIPVEHIILGGFEEAKSLQTLAPMSIIYTAADNQKCVSVLEELCRVTESYLHIRDNLIAYWQWRQYSGVLGTPITDADIVPGSYSHETQDDKVLNEYSIAYKNGASVLYAAGIDAGSRTKYGSGKIFAMPKDKVDSTDASKFKILYDTLAGATWAGSLVLSRWKDIKKLAKYTLGYQFNFLNLGDIADMRFAPYTREPAMLTSIKENSNRTLSIQAELVNYPPVVSLDIVPPDPVQLLSAIPDNGAVWLRWSKANEADVVGYNIYFTSSDGYWRDEVINGAISPKAVTPGSIIYLESDCLYKLEGLQNGVRYYFKIACFDTSYNISRFSNIISAAPYDTQAALYENKYMIAGSLFAGLSLNIANSENGSVPTEWAGQFYDAAHYDEIYYAPTAIYESFWLQSDSGFASLTFIGHGDIGDIMLQWRADNNGSYTPWSDPVNACGVIDLGTQGSKKVQVRAIFNAPLWSDPDGLTLRSLQEAA